MAPCGMDLLAHAWCRSPRGPYFSLLVQRKVGKRNTPRRSARRCAAGAQSRWEFSDGASCPGRKRRTSLCAALRVLPAGTAVPKGPQKQTRPRSACAVARAFGPHEARRVGRVKPEGRRPGWAAFSYGTGMCLTKIPGPLANPERAARRACRLGCAFFGYFLCTSKESDAPAASGAMPGPSGLFRKAIKRTGRQHGKPGDRGFVAPHPNPSLPQGLPSVAAGRGASSWGR